MCKQRLRVSMTSTTITTTIITTNTTVTGMLRFCLRLSWVNAATGDARHTSHVTRHSLHVSRHTSHFTRHTSHVTLHYQQRPTRRFSGSGYVLCSSCDV